jgi:hypothetical protein
VLDVGFGTGSLAFTLPEIANVTGVIGIDLTEPYVEFARDMARQRDLERAGWQFVRIRGGDFYRDREKSTAPLWAELERLGIKPGGIDQAAAEPPPPADGQSMERREVDEIIAIAPTRPVPADTDAHSAEIVENIADRKPETADDVGAHAPADVTRSTNSVLGDYVSYRDRPGPDPRTVGLSVVADNLCRIIEVEGPIIAKRAYDIYLRGCGIRRLGPELKSTLNRALARAVQQGRVVSENEPGKSGFIFSTMRSMGSPPVKLRCRGPRTFEEIPPAELRAVSRHVSESLHLEPGTDAHLRAILEFFDLKRLTAQVGTRLLEILDKPEESVVPLLDRVVGD